MIDAARLGVALLFVACGCGRVSFDELPPPSVVQTDAGMDAAADAGEPRDATAQADAGDPLDATVHADAGTDAGPTPCAYTCEVDLVAGSTTCTGTVSGSVTTGTFTATIDMSGREELEWTTTLCDPVDWVVHITDSPSGNGGGGDATQFSNDAEAQLVGTGLDVITNDLDPGGSASRIHTDPAYVPAAGCTTFTWTVRDQFFGSDLGAVAVSSPYILRIDPPTDPEGAPDALWYIGLNRTYGSAARVGTGVTRSTLCVR